MSEIYLQLDNKAEKTIDELKKYYHIPTNAELISLAIKLLNCAYMTESEHGQLISIVNGRRTIISFH